MTPVIAVAILALAAVSVMLLLLRSGRRGRRQWIEDVPPGMRPGYSDEQLENTIRVRYLAWGAVLTVFFALFLPLYWVYESGRLQREIEGFFVVSVERGAGLFEQNCAVCHGNEGQGGAAPSPYGQDTWPAPNLRTIAARYAENPTITDLREYVVTTIERGRQGTPMPTWGAAFGGPLTDQQIEEITDWILANQEDEAEPVQTSALSGRELYEGNCARCHGEQGEGIVGPSLVGVFERHNRETVMGILRNGINLGTGLTMPPWQNGYLYSTGPDEEGAPHYDDETLTRIVDYLEELQPDPLPEGAELYQTPGTGVNQAQSSAGEDQA